jgi:hypothetical protein
VVQTAPNTGGKSKTVFGKQYADNVSAAGFHDDNPTRETSLRENSGTNTLFLDVLHRYRLPPDSRSFQFDQGLIIQAERPAFLRRGHAVWLCTESPPKNGQGYHAVRRAGCAGPRPISTAAISTGNL